MYPVLLIEIDRTGYISHHSHETRKPGISPAYYFYLDTIRKLWYLDAEETKKEIMNMKRILALVLVLMVLTGTVYADTNNPYIIKGKGNQTITNLEFKSDYSRFIFHDEKDPYAFPKCYDENGEELMHSYYYNWRKYTIPTMIVESEGDWYIDYSPIGIMDSPSVTGKGIYVSDFFTIDKQTLISIKADYKKKEQSIFSVSLCYLKVDERTGTSSMRTKELVVHSDLIPLSASYVIQPDEKVTAFFWAIRCSDNVEWSITAK